MDRSETATGRCESLPSPTSSSASCAPESGRRTRCRFRSPQQVPDPRRRYAGMSCISYVYAEADPQRRREGGSRREALRGGPRHLGLAARRALSRSLVKAAQVRRSDAGAASASGSSPRRASRCPPPVSQPEAPVKRLLLDLKVFLDVIPTGHRPAPMWPPRCGQSSSADRATVWSRPAASPRFSAC